MDSEVAFDYPAPWTTNTADNSNEAVGGGDLAYDVDVNLVQNALGTVKAYPVNATTESYYSVYVWVVSRYYCYNSDIDYLLDGRFLNMYTAKYIGASMYYYYDGIWDGNPTSEKRVRPIVTLKANISTTGSGEKDDPYILP